MRCTCALDFYTKTTKTYAQQLCRGSQVKARNIVSSLFFCVLCFRFGTEHLFQLHTFETSGWKINFLWWQGLWFEYGLSKFLFNFLYDLNDPQIFATMKWLNSTHRAIYEYWIKTSNELEKGVWQHVVCECLRDSFLVDLHKFLLILNEIIFLKLEYSLPNWWIFTVYRYRSLFFHFRNSLSSDRDGWKEKQKKNKKIADNRIQLHNCCHLGTCQCDAE